MKFTPRAYISLTVFIFLVATACARNPRYDKAPPYSPHPSGEFPIIASYAFYPPYITEQEFQWAREAGFNVLRKMLGDKDIDSCLKLAARNGLYVMVSPWDIKDKNKVRDIVNRYMHNNHVWGYNVADEPHFSQFENLGEVMRELEALDPTQNGYINLFPEVGEKQLGISNYRTYVEEYVETVNPPFISFDSYPIQKNSKGEVFVNDSYYSSIEVIADVAGKSGRPFWSYVLCNRHAFYPKPTEAYIRFQVFAALAYGAQGLNYFTYLLPDFDKGKGEFSDAPIGLDGERTDVWYMVKNVNSEVHKLSGIFLGAKVVSHGLTGPKIPRGTRRMGKLPEPFRTISSNGKGLIVSHLRNEKSDYLMIVNRDVTKSQKVTLKRSRSVKRIYGDGSEKADIVSSFVLEAGSYAIFRI